MKRFFKPLALSLWRITGPFRQPVIRRIDSHILRLLGSVPRQPDIPADFDLVLNSLVRELTRLQLQVEILQQQIDDLQSTDRERFRPESRLSVVGETC
jgi:hypothetical protein